jgi:uncharacterized membrane protein YfcA
MLQSFIDWLPMLCAALAAGAFGGLIAGLLGVGGGIVIVPVLDAALHLAGVDPAIALKVAVATSMATIVPTAISSSRSHAKRNAIDFDVIRRWSVPIVVGALGGALLASHVDDAVLAALFGVIALLVAIKMLLPLDGLVLRPDLPRGPAGALIPAGIGGVSAMMGIGGGTLSVPAMTLCVQPVHRAVGTAALLGLWISVPATIGYLIARPQVVMPALTVGYVSLIGVAAIAPVSWLCAPYGARLAHSLDRRMLSAAFGLFLLVVSARMFYRLMH